MIVISEQIENWLFSLSEKEYGDFSASLMPTVDRARVIGVRVPLIRKLAKSLDGYDGFLENLPHKYVEENHLHAFLLEKETDFDSLIIKLNRFLPYVDNWATCDSMKPKVMKKHPEKLLHHIKIWLTSKDVYTVRYGINLLMSFFLDELFVPDYLNLVAEIKSDEYYINMMRAWFFATALAKQYEQTLPYIENKALDVWTHNKTLQKANESFRITKEQKAYLKTLKR